MRSPEGNLSGPARANRFPAAGQKIASARTDERYDRATIIPRECSGDAAANRFVGGAHRIGGEMRVARGRRCLGVPEESADDRQAEAGTGADRGKAVAQIM